eukprot:g3890.t1
MGQAIVVDTVWDRIKFYRSSSMASLASSVNNNKNVDRNSPNEQDLDNAEEKLENADEDVRKEEKEASVEKQAKLAKKEMKKEKEKVEAEKTAKIKDQIAAKKAAKKAAEKVPNKKKKKRDAWGAYIDSLEPTGVASKCTTTCRKSRKRKAQVCETLCEPILPVGTKANAEL